MKTRVFSIELLNPYGTSSSPEENGQKIAQLEKNVNDLDQRGLSIQWFQSSSKFGTTLTAICTYLPKE